MNTLIFGGLIAVAVVALIILVLVLMAEQRGQPAAPVAPEAAMPPAQVPAATPAAPAQASGTLAPTTAQAPKTTIPVSQPVFDQDHRRTGAFNGSQPLPETESLALIRIRGQLREIHSELRLLHKQSSAFEQRLAALTEAANYVERMIIEQTNTEEAEETLS